jgi:hypothetical protein
MCAQNYARAVILPGEETLAADVQAPLRLGPPTGAYLYEPDPAVIRSGLVCRLAQDLDAWLIDPAIAYLVGERHVARPFAQAFRIEESFAFSLKALREALKRRDVGRVIIKKRGFPQEPEELRKSLKLSGTSDAIVALTRIGTRHWAFILTRV